MTYYEYQHVPGYGRDDYMAEEIIARAARRLGAVGADHYIAQAVGLASHPIPLGSVEVRVPGGPGVRRRMERALSAARREVRHRDCLIEIVAYRWTGLPRVERECDRCSTIAELAPWSGEMTWEGEDRLRRARAQTCSCVRVRSRERREGHRWVEDGDVRV
jgi:hypothetical protein